MIEAIEVAYYEGQIFCAFSTRDECKTYLKEKYPDIDPFDVQLKTQYISDYKPSGYFER
jgi:viroplasmin and RNaseH domain-containing protein